MAFFKDEIAVDRSLNELMSELSAMTIEPDRRNYGQKVVFRGYIWQYDFKIELNTFYYNSFGSQAIGQVQPTGDNKCIVDLSIGPDPLVIVFTCIWNLLLLMALITVSISEFSESIDDGIEALLLFVPFIAIDALFLRCFLYSNFKKLKAKMLDFLAQKP